MGKTKKIVLFDIDYTLFNPRSFGEKVKDALTQKLGITDEHFLEIAKKADKESRREKGYYHPTIYLNTLKKEAGSNVALSELEEIYYNEKIYSESLYEDAQYVFETLVEKNIEIGIFSKGHDPFQRLKILALKDHLMNDKIHIFTDKLEKLPEVLLQYKNHEVCLIDDMLNILEEAKKINKNVTTIFIKRKERIDVQSASADFTPDYTIEKLKDLLPLIV